MASLYTLADLRSAAYTRLENNTLFWGLPEVDTIVNEALRYAALVTGFYQGSGTITSVAGQLVYAIPAVMIYPQRVTFNGMQLDPIPVTRIGQDYRTWTTDTSANQGQVARWVPIATNYFCLHPVDSLGGQTIVVSGVLTPPLLVNPGDAMVLTDENVNLIVEYCASRLPFKIGGGNFQQAAVLYQKSVLPAVKKLTNLRQFILPRFFVNKGAAIPEDKIQ